MEENENVVGLLTDIRELLGSSKENVECGRPGPIYRAVQEQNLQAYPIEAYSDGEQSPYPPKVLRQGYHRCLAVGRTRPFGRDLGTQVQRAADEER